MKNSIKSHILLFIACIAAYIPAIGQGLASVDSICINNTIYFTPPAGICDSTGATYLWNFGEGGISTDASPHYAYAVPGLFLAQLVISDSCGIDTFSQYIHVQCCGGPGGYLTLPDSVCQTDSFNIYYGGGNYYRLIAFGIPITIGNGSANDSIRLQNLAPPGNYPLQLIVATDSAFSCADTVTATFNSTACCHIEAYMIVEDSLCFNDSFTVLYGGGNYYKWIIDGLSDSTFYEGPLAIADIILNDLAPGYHSVQLLVSADGTLTCVDTISTVIFSYQCCSAQAFISTYDTLCYMDTFMLTLGGGHYYKFIIDGEEKEPFEADTSITYPNVNTLEPGSHSVIFIAGMDSLFECSDSVFTSYYSALCCPQSLHPYLVMPDTVCSMMDYVYAYGGGIYYQFSVDGVPGSDPFFGLYDITGNEINTLPVGEHQMQLVVGIDSMFSCTDTIVRTFVSSDLCREDICTINPYFLLADTICAFDSFFVQYGGGHYYHFAISGIPAGDPEERYEYQDLAISKWVEAPIPPGSYIIQMVVSMDTSFACADTVLTEVVFESCCQGIFKLDKGEVCPLDSVCYYIYGGDRFDMYGDSVTPYSYLFSSTIPFNYCGAVPPSVTEGYHTMICVIYSADSSCTDTVSYTLYIKPACACEESPVDTCPAMQPAFTYDIFPGYILLHDVSPGSPTYIEWFAGKQSFVTGPGDTLRYNFTQSGYQKICMSVHHLIFGSSICCIADTCISIYGTVDTCSVLGLESDFSYNINPEDPYSYNFFPLTNGGGFPQVVTWDFGDSSSYYNYTSEMVTHTFDTAGIYTVCVNVIWQLSGNYCCIDSQCYDVYVNPIGAEMRVMPNPFSQVTSFSYKIARPGLVDLSLVDNLGREVMALIQNQFYTDGYYQKQFNLGLLPKGVYTYRFKSADGLLTGKIVKQ
ncbi:MAG TPA: PKD domain-containing protein [Chitinophagales bacterium]|nr:PKD domain-containing protein [Chitinophagales bacterium]